MSTPVLVIYLIINALLIVWLLRIIHRLFVFLILKREGYLPYVPTPARVFRSVFNSGALNGRHKIIDLGSGSGILLAAIQKRYPHAELTGVEHSLFLATLARMRFWLIELFTGRKQPRIIHGDMFAHTVADYDTIVGFWVTDIMPRLLEKFEKETADNILIVSHRFKLPQNDMFDAMELRGSNPVILYRKRTQK